jgi:NAD(P)-dependent dehydrogenase (short-subunit alcohol dehydrogenase family)
MNGLMDGLAGLVTGGASGIGRATALAYAREGARVVIADIEASADLARETVALIEAAGGAALSVATFGGLDFAFNNAGILAVGFTIDVRVEEFERIFDVDVKGVWLCMKHQIRYMMSHGGGAIVNNASEAGLVGTPMAGPYVGAKHAVVGLTKTAAGEYANMGIRINAIAPGAIATPMVLSLPAEAQQSLLAPQPLNRFGRPEEVAEAVVFLSSSRASFILGTVLSIDGGATSNAQSYSADTSPSAFV